MFLNCLPISHRLETGDAPARKLLDRADAFELRRAFIPPGLPERPLVFHWGLGLVLDEFIPAFKAENIPDVLSATGARMFSFDLGPACRKNQHVLPLSPTLDVEAIKHCAAASLDCVRQHYDGPLAVENYNYYPTGLYEHVCRPDFIGAFLEEFELGFVLDLAHAMVSAANLKLDIKRYLLELPLGRVVEVHLSRPYVHSAMMVDAHDPPGDHEFELLEFVLTHLTEAGPVLIVVEYYRELKTLELLYERLGKTLDRLNREPGLSGGCFA